jgi:hypothetical protein
MNLFDHLKEKKGKKEALTFEDLFRDDPVDEYQESKKKKAPPLEIKDASRKAVVQRLEELLANIEKMELDKIQTKFLEIMADDKYYSKEKNLFALKERVYSQARWALRDPRMYAYQVVTDVLMNLSGFKLKRLP